MTMKQRITVEQLDELTFEKKERLRKWWKPEEGDFFCDRLNAVEINLVHGCDCGNNLGFHPDEFGPSYPLLSIGQMIAYIEDVGIYRITKFYPQITGENKWVITAEPGFSEHTELCDALWESVKFIL